MSPVGRVHPKGVTRPHVNGTITDHAAPLLTVARPAGPLTAELPVGPTADAQANVGESSRRDRGRSWWQARRTSIAVLTPLLVLAGLWQFIGMAGSPQRIDDEGTYVAQAYAVQTFHSLAQYTYWYDHPPLGWIQIAAYTWTTDAFGREPNAVLAGREAMLFFQLISCALLFLCCRRLLMRRSTSALAVLLFSLSPLAVQFHRTVYLDNVATPWILASIALALTPQRRLWAYAASGLCFAIAVLSKETSLLMLPMIAYLLWRSSARSGTRRYALSLAGSSFAIAGGFYVVYSIIKNELIPGAGHVSLLDGIKFQLFTRQASGSVFSSGSLGHMHIAQWLQLDTVFPVVAVLCLGPAFFVRRLRPFAVGFAILLLTMVRPGYLPVPFVIAMIPLAALLVAGVVDAGISWVPARWKTRAAGGRWPNRFIRAPFVPVIAAGVVVALAFGTPAWATQQRGLFRADLDAPVAQAETWIEANVPHSARLTVDDAFWVDLVRAGFPRDNVVWYYKVDTDPAVEALSPNGWKDYDYVVSTQSLRTNPEAAPQVAQALKNSVPYAIFGSGDTRVEVRRVMPGGVSDVPAATKADQAARTAADQSLLGNPAVTADAQSRGVLSRGDLDLRAATSLAVLAAGQSVTVRDLLADPGETAAGLPVRTVEIKTAGTGTSLTSLVAGLPAAYRPISEEPTTDGFLRLAWSPAVAPVLPA